MNLFRKINEIVEGNSPSPHNGNDWSIGILPNKNFIISCDGFSLKLDNENFDFFLNFTKDKKSGEIRDQRKDLIFVEPTDTGVILTRQNDKVFPSGILISKKTISSFISFTDKDEKVNEGVKLAYRRSGKKIKRGFRVTSGIRRGRVVANIKTAHKPRAKASTRTKLRLAAKKKKVIRVMRSRITRKKSLSQRIVRMNKRT